MAVRAATVELGGARAGTLPDGAAIAERAYYKAERRGFVPGFELNDWLAAEQELRGAAAKPKRRSPAAPRRKKTAKTERA